MKHVQVRIPDQLHAAARALAKADHRSLNGLILALLERAVAANTTDEHHQKQPPTG